MAIEETHHQDHQNSHQHGDDPDKGHMCSFLVFILRQILSGVMNDHLGKSLPRLRMTPLTGREGSFFVFEGSAVVCAVAIGAERRIFVAKVHGGFAVVIIQVCGGLGGVAGAADGNHLPADFHTGLVTLDVMVGMAVAAGRCFFTFREFAEFGGGAGPLF